MRSVGPFGHHVLFDDRHAAGRALAPALERTPGPVVVYGLARGGVPVAAEVAAALGAPLDALVVRKIGHPRQPEFALGAVAPDGPAFLMPYGGIDPDTVEAVRGRVRAAHDEGRAMDARLHAETPPIPPSEMTCVLVDDGLATGATMVAACRWARAHGGARIVAAVPVAASESLAALRSEADEVVCPYPVADFMAVSTWYRDFGQTSEDEVRRLLRAARGPAAGDARGGVAAGGHPDGGGRSDGGT